MQLIQTKQLLLSALSFFPLDMTLEQKLEYLSKFIDPPPRAVVTIDPDEERSQEFKDSPEKLRGYIKISPPRGHCFNIIRGNRQEDQMICKPSYLSFSLQDLDSSSRINWLIEVSDMDMKIPIYWQTPYQVGKVVDYNMEWPGPSKVVLIKSCTAYRSKALGGRRISLGLFHDEKWTITFPEKDLLVPQPVRGKPNLYVQEAVMRTGFIKVETEEEKKARITREKAEKEAGISSQDSGTNNPNFIKSKWWLHPRDAFQMSGSNVRVADSHLPSSKGHCRYKYRYKDREMGAVECFNTPNFNWLLLPLSCFDDIRPVDRK